MTTSIYDLIAFHARFRPGALAVIGREEVVRYGELWRDIDALAAFLLERGVSSWSLAGIDLGTTYLHLVAILALDRLNVASLSLTSTFPTTTAWLLRQGGRAGTISQSTAPDGDGAPSITIEPDWREQPASAAHRGLVKELRSSPDAVVRIVLSSGTTGSPKAVAVTRSVQMRGLQDESRPMGTSYLTRVLTVSFHGLTGRFMGSLAAGGTVVLADWDDEIADAIERFSVTYMTATPIVVDSLLGITRRTGARYPSLQRLVFGGGRLPRQAAVEALRLLTPHAFVGYATTEVGWIACAHASVLEHQPDAVGYLMPGCELEVVDDAGRPLPAGTPGSVRVRKPVMAQGYLDDPETTASHFRDGWFHPSDVAAMEPSGMVRFVGRTDEVIDSRGFKIGPTMIEDVFRSQPGVLDVAAFAAPAMSGGDEPWVALVCEPGISSHDLLRTGMRQLGVYAPVKHLDLDTLPRTENGKILRRVLRDMVISRRANRQEPGEG